jgi:two-component system sensor histidine kinase PilS (NtrC family)
LPKEINQLFDDPSHNPDSDSLKAALQIYTLYRLLQISALLILFLLGSSTGYLGERHPNLFFISALVYFALCAISLAQTSIKALPSLKGRGVVLLFLIDVLAIISFIHFSGGKYGSLGILLVVVVATAGIFLRGRLALFIAALASLGILSEQIYLYLTFDDKGDNFATTGILGLALFGAALTVQQLAERLRTSEKLLSQQSEQMHELEKINEQIIERMPNGVIVVNQNLQVQFMNTSAWQLLSSPKIPDNTPLHEISPSLGRLVHAWLNNPNIKPETFNVGSSGPALSANFAHLGEVGSDNKSGTIIFIEDSSLMAERAQKMKLASLGTLTAGIAHEIRNPLGAISHAAQLLEESSDINDADKRMIDIIQQHSIRMNRIIENVLQLSRQKAGHQEDIYLQLWLKNFIKDFRATKPFKVEIHLSISNKVGHIRADGSQLAQVLTNLFENGLRYSYSKTDQYYLSITCDYDEEQHFHFIDIKDKGPGINSDEAEQIFEPFFTTDAQGSGLGLYIARELCENNFSKLIYLPQPEGGGCFRIIFSK